MSTQEKLIVVYSRVGWEKLTSSIASIHVSDRNRKIVLDIINDNDCHQIDPSGAHLLYWSECDTTCSDMNLLLSTFNGAIPSSEWFVSIIFNNGMEDSYGVYHNNSFAPRIERQFNWEDHHAIKGNRLNISNPAPAAPVVTAALNNHKCGACGNDRCSKQEKSCWKCGNPL